jgi:hypothetical protein
MGDETRHPSSGLLRVGEALPFRLVVRGWATWDGSLCSICGEGQKIRSPLRMRLFGLRWWHDKGLWQRDQDMKPYPSLCLDESNSIRSCDEDISLKMSR